MNLTEQTRVVAVQDPVLHNRRPMLLREVVKLAIDNFGSNRLRFVLTALGMVIGTASVILVATIGLTGKQYVLQEIQKIGTNSVEVEYSASGATGVERTVYNDFLTREDEKAVVSEIT